jgi:hypothetical protein
MAAQHFQLRKITPTTKGTTMPNYYYFDASGQKYGLVNDQRLQALAAQGVITPNTPLETEGGHRGVAGQIPGLRFPVQTGDSDAQVSDKGLTLVEQFRFRSDTEDMPIFSLLSDFSFRELQPETIFLWFTKFVYGVGLIAIILGGLIYCGTTAFGAFSLAGDTRGASLLLLLTLPLICLACFVGICWLRFCCEWTIITFHYSIRWLIGLAKLPYAVCMFLEAKSKEGK